jgi:hypothetical protein
VNNPAAKKTRRIARQWITVGKPPFRIEQVDTFLAHLGRNPPVSGRATSEPPTKEHADKFFAKRFGPELANAFGLEPVGRPEVIGLEVACSYVQTLASRLTPSDGD